jgi:hypothetical protein
LVTTSGRSLEGGVHGRHRVLLGAGPEGELRRAESGARDAMARN